MMVAGRDRPEEIDPSGVRKLMRLLDPLRASPAGSVIHRQVEAMLEEIAADHLKTEIAYSGFVNVLLESYLSGLTPGSSQFVQLKLLQARLQPPLTHSELIILGEFINQLGAEIRTSRILDPALMMEAVSPLLAAFGIESFSGAATPEAASPAAAPAPAPAPAPEEAEDDDDLEMAHPKAISLLDETQYPDIEDELGEAELEDELAAPYPGEEEAGELAEEAPEADEDYLRDEIPAGQDLNALHRSELEARRDDIAQLQSTLGQQVLETISQNEEFGVILEVVLAELQQSEDVTEIENLRWTLVREVEKLLKGHNELADKLDNTQHYLQMFASDSRELTDELTRVRLLSLTDELTSLPNRRAFMRRLEDEVARVQRYGFPLSFVLIDLDHFKSINDEYGHAAGDEVLRVYSKNILSIFRHHDMVARYGGEEFAVLLPNTDSDGAVRALNKVRRRANETRWQTNGTMSNVPTFSAGVSLYKPGESATAFIERADKALYRAKRLGRNRIELDMTYENEAGRGIPRRRSTDT
jgi:diguanylate cyclase (GGDEF)-like protein